MNFIPSAAPKKVDAAFSHPTKSLLKPKVWISSDPFAHYCCASYHVGCHSKITLTVSCGALSAAVKRDTTAPGQAAVHTRLNGCISDTMCSFLQACFSYTSIFHMTMMTILLTPSHLTAMLPIGTYESMTYLPTELYVWFKHKSLGYIIDLSLHCKQNRVKYNAGFNPCCNLSPLRCKVTSYLRNSNLFRGNITHLKM